VLRGTRDGGAFETPFLRVSEMNEQGLMRSADLYEESDFEHALARFAEIGASERRDPLVANPRSNAAGAALERWRESYERAFETGDFEPIRALCTPGVVFDDRRRLASISGDRNIFVASARERVAMGAHPLLTLLATAGDRVVLQTMLWSGGPTDGRFEIEYIAVGECDDSGLLTAVVLFDSDDPRAAQREAWARWAAIDPGVAPWVELLNAMTDGWNARDRAAIRARFADDVVVVDRRHTGIGRIEGAAAYVDANAVLWDLAPDQRVEFDSSGLRFDRHALLVTLRRVGTLVDGGAFESAYVWVSLVIGGRITLLELFEIDAIDAALARFEALGAARD
jgi:ketosteroid isomerase-like protein